MKKSRKVVIGLVIGVGVFITGSHVSGKGVDIPFIQSAVEEKIEYEQFVIDTSRELDRLLLDLESTFTNSYGYSSSKYELDSTLRELDYLTSDAMRYSSLKVPREYQQFHRDHTEAMEHFNFVANNLGRSIEEGDEFLVNQVFDEFRKGQNSYDDALYEMKRVKF